MVPVLRSGKRYPNVSVAAPKFVHSSRKIAMLREELKNISSTPREVRKFGLTMALALLLLAAILWWKERHVFAYILALALLLGLSGTLVPTWLQPLQRIWMTLAVLMGFVMNRVILALLFFGMFTPVALFLKVFRKDLLHQRWDKKAESYWVKRASRRYQPASSEKMY